jgi:hypothetical protein
MALMGAEILVEKDGILLTRTQQEKQPLIMEEMEGMVEEEAAARQTAPAAAAAPRIFTQLVLAVDILVEELERALTINMAVVGAGLSTTAPIQLLLSLLLLRMGLSKLS